MRRTIQDLVASVDPNVKMEPEVEDVCCFFVSSLQWTNSFGSCSCLLLTSSSTRSQISPVGLQNIEMQIPSK